MRYRFILMLVVAIVLAGCVAVQRTDDAGTPLVDEKTGTPIVDHEFSPAAAVEVVTVAAPFLPPPWSVAAPILSSLLIALFNKKG